MTLSLSSYREQSARCAPFAAEFNSASGVALVSHHHMRAAAVILMLIPLIIGYFKNSTKC